MTEPPVDSRLVTVTLPVALLVMSMSPAAEIAMPLFLLIVAVMPSAVASRVRVPVGAISPEPSMAVALMAMSLPLTAPSIVAAPAAVTVTSPAVVMPLTVMASASSTTTAPAAVTVMDLTVVFALTAAPDSSVRSAFSPVTFATRLLLAVERATFFRPSPVTFAVMTPAAVWAMETSSVASTAVTVIAVASALFDIKSTVPASLMPTTGADTVVFVTSTSVALNLLMVIEVLASIVVPVTVSALITTTAGSMAAPSIAPA